MKCHNHFYCGREVKDGASCDTCMYFMVAGDGMPEACAMSRSNYHCITDEVFKGHGKECCTYKKKEEVVMDKQDIIEVEPKPVTDIVYQPDAVMKAAITASKALQEVVSKKPRPVKINGEQYLEFEDWQTCGRFYGVTAKALTADLVEIDGIKGFKATAVAMKDGVEISGAVAYCMRDEKNWETKPMFQLASMAQTRASAKALRNVLAWVVVLAGYKATPAEEMTDTTPFNNGSSTPPAAAKQYTKPSAGKYATISGPQAKRFYAICHGSNVPEEIIDAYLEEACGVDSAEKITPEKYEAACDWAKNWTE